MCILIFTGTPRTRANCHLFYFCFQDNCQNYIRVLAKMVAGRLLVCGTNSYKPLCREYIIEVRCTYVKSTCNNNNSTIKTVNVLYFSLVTMCWARKVPVKPCVHTTPNTTAHTHMSVSIKIRNNTEINGNI